MNNKHLFLEVLRLGSLWSGCQHGLFWGGVPPGLQMAVCLPSHCVLTVEKQSKWANKQIKSRNRPINKEQTWLPRGGWDGQKWVKASGRHRFPGMKWVYHEKKRHSIGNTVNDTVRASHGDRGQPHFWCAEHSVQTCTQMYLTCFCAAFSQLFFFKYADNCTYIHYFRIFKLPGKKQK